MTSDHNVCVGSLFRKASSALAFSGFLADVLHVEKMDWKLTLMKKLSHEYQNDHSDKFGVAILVQ